LGFLNGPEAEDMTPLTILLLYISFRIKQFVCDFLLQTDWMAVSKGKPGPEGVRALFSHTLVHAAGTGVICIIFEPSLWWLALVDLGVHSLVDRVKGVYTLHKHWTPKDTIFWWTLGLDQEAHNFTHLAYILAIIAASGGVVVP